jgi:hypothetical protein
MITLIRGRHGSDRHVAGGRSLRFRTCSTGDRNGIKWLRLDPGSIPLLMKSLVGPERNAPSKSEDLFFAGLM